MGCLRNQENDISVVWTPRSFAIDGAALAICTDFIGGAGDALAWTSTRCRRTAHQRRTRHQAGIDTGSVSTDESVRALFAAHGRQQAPSRQSGSGHSAFSSISVAIIIHPVTAIIFRRLTQATRISETFINRAIAIIIQSITCPSPRFWIGSQLKVPKMHRWVPDAHSPGSPVGQMSPSPITSSSAMPSQSLSSPSHIPAALRRYPRKRTRRFCRPTYPSYNHHYSPPDTRPRAPHQYCRHNRHQDCYILLRPRNLHTGRLPPVASLSLSA